VLGVWAPDRRNLLLGAGLRLRPAGGVIDYPRLFVWLLLLVCVLVFWGGLFWIAFGVLG